MTACCRRAQAAGVRSGLSVAGARAHFSDAPRQSSGPRFWRDDPSANRKALQELAWDCEAFAPLVGIEDVEAPTSLLMDISGCAACFKGESNLVEQLLKAMQDRRFHVRIGVADTIGAAWAVAHFRTQSQATVGIPLGRHEEALRPLPIEALRLSAETARKLRDLDLRRVSQVLALPRRSLPSRFGRELLLRIDQALGDRRESILPERRPVALWEVWQSESPLQDTGALETILAELVGRLIERLAQQGAGLVGLRVELSSTSLPANLSLALMRPTTDRRHVMDLLRLQWERGTLPAEVIQIQTEVTESRVLTTEAQCFWDSGEQDRRRDAAELIEKLSSRLGPEAVLRPVLQSEQQPEFAYRNAPCLTRTRTRAGGEERSLLPLSRPLWLKRSPIPVNVLSVVPDGPPYRLSWEGRHERVARCWGPERITTGWWRGAHIRRDYYHVETADGHRLWVFRDWTKQRWYLHAAFD